MMNIMQGYGYDFNNPINVGGTYKVEIEPQTFKFKGKILKKLDIDFSNFGELNEIEKEIIEQINAENTELYHKIIGKIKFYKKTIGIILLGNEIILDKKQIYNDKSSYNQIKNNLVQNNKELLNEKEFKELSEIFENNTEILKKLLNINFNYIWGEDGLVFNFSNDWNAGHIQPNINFNKRTFRLGTIYKNKKL